MMRDRELTERGHQMLALAREYEEAGGDVRDFARRAGVKPQTFTWWRSRLRRHLARDVSDFVELVVRDEVPRHPMRVVVGDGVVVEVQAGFDGDEVRRLVEALRGC